MPNGRIHSDWIETCVAANATSNTPEPFRRWGALSAVAGALGRRCWYDAGEYQVRPNLYTVLVAPPGHNKSVSLILPFGRIFNKLSEPLIGKREDIELSRLSWGKYIPDPPGQPLHLVSGRITPERLCQLMQKASHPVLDLPPTTFDASLTIKTNEFGQFMTRQNQFLQIIMTEGWDAVELFEYQTKHQGDDSIKGVCINWIAAATPSEFIANMPANATEQGLLSRIIPVFHVGDPPRITTKTDGTDSEVIEELASDLGQIATINGPFVWEPGLEEDVIQPWIDRGMEPRPTDPMMQEYCSRRFSHLIKMSMSISASRRPTRVITADDWATALTMLATAEDNMPFLLRRFGMSDAGRFMDDLHEFLRKQEGKFVKLSVLRREAMRTAKNLSEVESAIKNLLESKLVEVEGELVRTVG